MSKATDGIELTRVGEGTVMGDLMRCYWIPALMSSELVRDGAPVRLMLLGEKLIAFRDSAGRVGVMDHRCPHRCASLFLGRNEEEGIRCIYHGWKFDVAGNCVDMPSLPPPGFKEKVKAKAYKVVERAGVVWVYMGTRAEAPPLPAFEILDLPEDEVKVTFIQRDCNYLQALEGEIDTSHFGFLHAGHVDPDDLSDDEPVRNTVINRAPEYHLADTEWGTQYAGYRECRRRAGPTGASATSCFRSGRRRRTASSARTCMRAAGCRSTMSTPCSCFLSWKKAVHAGSLPQPAFKDGSPIGGTGRANKLLPNTTDWLGRWRMAANAGNDWEIDRDAQQSNRIYSGIDGIHLQDQAITESMGPIVDHEFEHLAPSDQMITRTRRRLLMAARALRERGTAPPGADNPEVYRGARSGYLVSPDQSPWRELYAKQFAASAHPPQSPLRAAE